MPPSLSTQGCPFCTEAFAARAVWQFEHYLVVADELPRCVGHVLLVTRAHFASHMDAPTGWQAELEAARALVRRFLEESFGAASFWENGGPDKEVPHAHLHGVPRAVTLREHVRAISGWDDVRREYARTGVYTYAANEAGALLVLDREAALREVRRQFGTPLLPNGGLQRLGTEAVAATRALWAEWAATRAPVANL